MDSPPRVSIVIPVWNKRDLTLQCLQSLEANLPSVQFEVIIVDNGSTDDTPELLSHLEGDVVTIRNDENLGFSKACNQGAAVAQGEYILFLNNDTILLPGWCEPLVDALDEDPRRGGVQPKLLFPDGRLNDAGGLIFADGEAWRYGMNSPYPEKPEYSCRRAPDYLSGACVMIRREAFERVGGFDERFTPAYYEDDDLSFALRAAGYTLLYEPESRVIHIEGGTAGTDTSQGIKQYQVINKAKFVEKWADELANRPKMDPAIVENWAHRGQGGFGPAEEPVGSWNEALVRQRDSRSIIVLDPFAPMYDRNSGHQRLWNVLKELRSEGHSVIYYSTGQFEHRYKSELSKLGIPIYGLDESMSYTPGSNQFTQEVFDYLRPDVRLMAQTRNIDTVWISFWEVAEIFVPEMRNAFPKATIVVDSVDIHYLRERREAELNNDTAGIAKAADTRRRETAIYASADRVICVTEADASVLQKELPRVETIVIPNSHESVESGPGFNERKDILFVGNFNHSPNFDAMNWWYGEIGPALAKELPNVRLRIVGNDINGITKRFENSNIESIGWVPETLPYLHSARISVAPLRYGAGMKGKVGEALSAGLPVVATPIAAEGMDLADGEDVLIAETAEEFVAAIVRLYNDEGLWNDLRSNGKNVAEERWGLKSLRGPINQLLAPKKSAAKQSAKARR